MTDDAKAAAPCDASFGDGILESEGRLCMRVDIIMHVSFCTFQSSLHARVVTTSTFAALLHTSAALLRALLGVLGSTSKSTFRCFEEHYRNRSMYSDSELNNSSEKSDLN